MMLIHHALFGCVLFVGAFLLRALVALSAPANYDTYGHLYFAREVKQQRSGPFGSIRTRVVGAGDFRQPFLWHWLIGLLPSGLVERHQHLVNPCVDSLFAVLVYFAALAAGLSFETALLAGALYAATPMWFSSFAIGPRTASLTPRLFSEIVMNVYFMILLLPLPLDSGMRLVIATLLGCVVLLSSKFGLQAMLFLCPVLALLTFDALPFLAMLAACTLAMIVPKANFLPSVKTQWAHLVWYFKENIRGEMPISSRNRLAALSERPSGMSTGRYFIVLGGRLLSGNSYTATAIKMPQLWLLAVVWPMAAVDVPAFLADPVGASVLVFLLINLRWLLFLGEAERYINHVAFFVCAAFAVAVAQASLMWLGWCVVVYGVLFCAAEAMAIRHTGEGQKRRALADATVAKFLARETARHTVLTYPFFAVGVWRVLLETLHRVIYVFTTDPAWRQEFQRFESQYPFVKLELLEEIAARYDVDVLVADRDELVARGFRDWKPPAGWYEVELNQSVYGVYRLRKDPA